MALRYLLDTGILSDLIRHPQGTVADRITTAGEVTVCTGIIVVAELRFGANKSNSTKLAQTVDLILSAVEILPLESIADRHYGELRDYLSRQGMLIAPKDLLIAAHTLASDQILVTANIREYSRVPVLKVENRLNPWSLRIAWKVCSAYPQGSMSPTNNSCTLDLPDVADGMP